jgi:hypothetical protein
MALHQPASRSGNKYGFDHAFQPVSKGSPDPGMEPESLTPKECDELIQMEHTLQSKRHKMAAGENSPEHSVPFTLDLRRKYLGTLSEDAAWTIKDVNQ